MKNLYYKCKKCGANILLVKEKLCPEQLDKLVVLKYIILY